MATKKTTKKKTINLNPNPVTVADALRIAGKWFSKRVTKLGQTLLLDANVEVSKRRIAMRAWRVLPDGRVRMESNRYIYLSTTNPAGARAAWKRFCEEG